MTITLYNPEPDEPRANGRIWNDEAEFIWDRDGFHSEQDPERADVLSVLVSCEEINTAVNANWDIVILKKYAAIIGGQWESFLPPNDPLDARIH